MPDAAYSDAMKRRLGLPLACGTCAFGSPDNPCGAQIPADDPHHPFVCPHAPHTSTHDHVKSSLQSCLSWLRLKVIDLDTHQGTEHFHCVIQPQLGDRPLPHKPDIF
eukprot:6691214-Karenia_brevis.AAC.1